MPRRDALRAGGVGDVLQGISYTPAGVPSRHIPKITEPPNSVTRNRNMMSSIANGDCVATLAVLLIGVADVRADPIPPWGPGPNAVGCSNIAQDFSRVASGNPAGILGRQPERQHAALHHRSPRGSGEYADGQPGRPERRRALSDPYVNQTTSVRR
mgnify:CR=1 FL=1